MGHSGRAVFHAVEQGEACMRAVRASGDVDAVPFDGLGERKAVCGSLVGSGL